MTYIEKFEELKGAKFFMFNLRTAESVAYDYCCDGREGDKDSIYCWNLGTGEIERVCRNDMQENWFYRRDYTNRIEILEVTQTILADRLERVERIVDEFYKKRDDDMHFSIERYMNGQPVCTRGGEKVNIMTTERADADYPIVALVGEDEVPVTYTANGEVMKGCVSENDLRIYQILADEDQIKNYNEMEEEAR